MCLLPHVVWYWTCDSSGCYSTSGCCYKRATGDSDRNERRKERSWASRGYLAMMPFGAGEDLLPLLPAFFAFWRRAATSLLLLLEFPSHRHTHIHTHSPLCVYGLLLPRSPAIPDCLAHEQKCVTLSFLALFMTNTIVFSAPSDPMSVAVSAVLVLVSADVVSD